MSIEHGSGRVQLSAAEEQMVRALAERTHAFFRELNPAQRVMDQAEGCWVHEVLPEAALQARQTTPVFRTKLALDKRGYHG